jgi:hypothetical protein
MNIWICMGRGLEEGLLGAGGGGREVGGGRWSPDWVEKGAGLLSDLVACAPQVPAVTGEGWVVEGYIRPGYCMSTVCRPDPVSPSPAPYPPPPPPSLEGAQEQQLYKGGVVRNKCAGQNFFNRVQATNRDSNFLCGSLRRRTAPISHLASKAGPTIL